MADDDDVDVSLLFTAGTVSRRLVGKFSWPPRRAGHEASARRLTPW